MVFAIIKWCLISLTLIFLIHHLYMFLLNTLTVPKIKDLVNKPNEQYRDIFATLEKKSNAKHTDVQSNTHMQSNTDMNTKSNTDMHTKSNMEDELSSFLQELKQTKQPSSIPAASDFLSANTNEYTPFNV